MKMPLFVIFIFLFQSCQMLTEQENLESIATIEYENIKAECGLENYDFVGPVFLNSIDRFPPDTNSVVFGWYYIYEADTFWMYSEVNKQSHKVSVHLSSFPDKLIISNKQNKN